MAPPRPRPSRAAPRCCSSTRTPCPRAVSPRCPPWPPAWPRSPTAPRTASARRPPPCSRALSPTCASCSWTTSPSSSTRPTTSAYAPPYPVGTRFLGDWVLVGASLTRPPWPLSVSPRQTPAPLPARRAPAGRDRRVPGDDAGAVALRADHRQGNGLVAGRHPLPGQGQAQHDHRSAGECEGGRVRKGQGLPAGNGGRRPPSRPTLRQALP